MKIGIIGRGFVGDALASVLEGYHELFSYDRYKEPYKSPKSLKKSDVVFLCVPTPMKEDGNIDLSVIHDSLNIPENVISDIKPLIVMRSTTVPGTADKLASEYPFRFASNPEFLREKHAVEDMRNTRRIVIGTEDKADLEKVLACYKPVFPDAQYISVDRKTAEMIKYSSNSLLAGQIALANEIYQICQTLGVDYDLVKNALLLDERIARNIDVPGFDGDLGFGGKCLPKDLRALVYTAKSLGYNSRLLEEVWSLNERVRKDKDWLKIVGATSEKGYREK